MENLNGKTILVVGASGAFGAEFASQFQSLGANVLGTASSVESSVRLNADLDQRLILDLTSPQSIENFANHLKDETIDGIVLASGLVAFGAIGETPSWVSEKLMKVNALGQIDLVTKLIPNLMKSSSNPFVLSISGVISEAPMAGLAAYSASKTALAGFAKAASKELRKVGINWIDARPGHTESGLASRAIFGNPPAFGTGLNVTNVVTRIVDGIRASERDLPSTAFN